MSKIGIDTSTDCAFLSLFSDNAFIDVVQDDKNHSENLLRGIKALSDRAKDKVDSLYLTLGPGSFTGLRVAMASAKGISSALGVPVFALSTLETYAYSYTDTINAKGLTLDDSVAVVPVIDAKKGRFYSAIFKYVKGGVERLSDDMDISLDNLIETIREKKCKRVLFIAAHGVDLPSLDLGFEHEVIALDKCQNPAHSLILHATRPLGISEGAVYIRPVDAKQYL